MSDPLDDIKEELLWIRDHIIKTREDIATLNVKSGVWGFLAGLIPSITALVLVYLQSR